MVVSRVKSCHDGVRVIIKRWARIETTRPLFQVECQFGTMADLRFMRVRLLLVIRTLLSKAAWQTNKFSEKVHL